MNEILCGMGEVEFTPPPGLPLMGNLRNRDGYTSSGTHDPLKGVALVFCDSSGEEVAVLSLDLCMVNRDQVGMMRKWIEEETSIPHNRILINATHTHAGPATMAVYTSPVAEEDDIEFFLKKASAAVSKAQKDLRSSILDVGYSSEARVSFNRRLKNRKGKTLMNWESFDPDSIEGTLGPVDSDLTVLSIKHGMERVGALVNFPLHPAILDYENYLYSADYPGALREGLGKIMGGNFKTFFANGCCGNINHIDYKDSSAPRRGYAAVERVGYMLAASAAEGLNKTYPIADSTISVSREFVTLQRLPITEEKYQWSKNALEKISLNAGIVSGDGLPEENSAPVWIDMYEKQYEDDKVEVMVIRIGNLAVVGLPGEVFCELGIYIRKKSVSRHTIVIELANDAIGYLPDEASFGQGGYEDTPGSTKYVKGSGEKLAASALSQIKRLFGT